MSDDLDTTTPAPAPAPASVPVDAAQPWQVRLEVLSSLLLVATAVTVTARLVTAYDQARAAGPFASDSADLVSVVRTAGLSVAVPFAGAIVISFLLVTLGPGGAMSPTGVTALRGVVVMGLAVAGLAAFGGIATIFQNDAGLAFGADQNTARDLVTRCGLAAPVLAAAAIAGYVAWCAFTTLGDVAENPS